MTRLRLYRLLREFTQEEVADAIGKSQPQYLRYERGDSPIPAELLPQLAHKLGISVEAFTSEYTSLDVIALTHRGTQKGSEHASN